MKKKILAYFSGVFATVLVLTMVTTALAASGKATFNFVNVSLRGERKIAAGADITVANGQKVPSSILYTDEKGGKTNYLPIRAISELLGVEIKYDSATKTVQLEKQPTAVDAGALGQWSRSFEANMVGYRFKREVFYAGTGQIRKRDQNCRSWGSDDHRQECYPHLPAAGAG